MIVKANGRKPNFAIVSCRIQLFDGSVATQTKLDADWLNCL